MRSSSILLKQHLKDSCPPVTFKQSGCLV